MATSQVTVEAGVPSSAETTLSSVSSVAPGSEFVVRLGLNKVTSQVYAEDFVLNYDENLLEFVSAKSVKDKVSLVVTKIHQVNYVLFLLAKGRQRNYGRYTAAGSNLPSQVDLTIGISSHFYSKRYAG